MGDNILFKMLIIKNTTGGIFSTELMDSACQARPYKLRCNIRLSGVLINSFSITSSDVAVAPTAATCNEPSRSPAWRLFVSRDAYSSLKSPLCSCVSITLPASS